jgi:hypothetical protein
VRVRPINRNDYVRLEAICMQRDYKFEIPGIDSKLTEEAVIVESDAGEVIAAGFAIRTPEIVLLMGNGHPVVKLEAIRRIHEVMREMARRKGYKRGFAVVSPALKAYARHMVRKFNWVKDFTAYRIE